MKKINAMEKINTEYAKNIHYVGKGAQNGAHGNAFEGSVKLFLNGRIYGDSLVSAPHKCDVQYKGTKIECKTGAGTLENVSKSKLVCYSWNATLENARVYTVSQFMEILNACGLVRDKKMSNNRGTLKTIQTFTNSKKKFQMFTTMLTENGISLAEYKTLQEC